MNPLIVAIRANGGEVIGLGHLRRCLSLAQALSRQGATVLFVTNDEQAGLGLIRDNGFEVTIVDSKTDFEQTRDAIGRWKPFALVVDSYDISANYLTRMREHVRCLIAVDDVADRCLPVDIVINGGVYALSLAYEALPNTEVLLGPSYALLRDEFALPPVRNIEDRVRRILLTMGGGDPGGGIFRRLIEWILEEVEGVDLDVVIGPFVKDKESIFEAAMRRPQQVRVYSDPPDMRSLMLAADLAITSGGQTTYELAATGTPAVGFCIAANQRMNLEGFEARGTLVFAGYVEDPDLKKNIIRAVDELASNTDRRREMSVVGRKLIDGQGAERAAGAIVRACQRRICTEVSVGL